MKNRHGEDVVFVIGSPRSGTTWLQRLLASHPLIETSQESNFFISYAKPLLKSWNDDVSDDSGRGGIGLPCYLSELEFYKLIRNLFYSAVVDKAIKTKVGARIFLEKTPSHALVVEEINRILPHARFIFIVRDPRDVVSSIVAASKSWGKDWAPTTTLHALAMWRRHVVKARQGLSKLPKNLYITIRYEDLLEDAAETLKTVFHFLGIVIDEEVIKSAIAENSIDKIGGRSFHVRGEIALRAGEWISEPKGFVRSGKKGGWRNELGILRGWLIKFLVGKEMKRYRYD